MNKRFKQKLKSGLMITLSLMLCFSLTLLTSGCNFIFDGDLGSDKPATEIDIATDSSLPTYTLTIYVNGGKYPGSEGDVIVTGNAGNTYTLQTPSHTKYDFDGWVLIDGPGSFNGVTFTFANGNAEIKATWQGALIPDLHDYLKGARFTYKPEPELLRGTDYIEDVKTQLNLMGKDIWSRLLNYYLDGAEYEVIAKSIGWAENSGYYIDEIESYTETYTEYTPGEYDSMLSVLDWNSVDYYASIYPTFKQELKAKIDNFQYHLQFLYVGVITGQYEKQPDGTYAIQSKNGLNFENDLHYIMTGNPNEIQHRYNSKIEDYAIYIDHTGLLDYEQEIFADLIISEIIGAQLIEADTNFSNNDGQVGFGAELYFNNLTLESDDDRADSDELFAQKDELFDSLGNIKFFDADRDGMFDCWTKETFIAKGLCTEETYNPEKYYYHIYLTETGSLDFELKINGASVSKANVGRVINGKFLPESDYVFDIRLEGFKNYKNHVNALVKNMANAIYLNKTGEKTYAYPYFPALYVQDLDSGEITIDGEGKFFNNKILTNTAGSGLSLQSVILNIKKTTFIQNLEFYVGFESEQNTKLNLNVKARYYHNGELYNIDFVDLNGKKEISIKSGDEAKSVSFDFAQASNAIGIKDNGLIVNPYNSKLNNYSVITDSSDLKYYRTKIATSIENFDQCFNLKENSNQNGSIAEYADYGSDFLEILFDAEKIDGVAPSYNLTFFYMDPLVQETAEN